jgi:hypothetical protein
MVNSGSNHLPCSIIPAQASAWLLITKGQRC